MSCDILVSARLRIGLQPWQTGVLHLTESNRWVLLQREPQSDTQEIMALGSYRVSSHRWIN